MEDMNSQCGSFTFRGRKIRGCMLTCNDHLCNGAAANGLPFNRAYEMFFDNPFSQSNSLLQIVLGVKVSNLKVLYTMSSISKKIQLKNYSINCIQYNSIFH